MSELIETILDDGFKSVMCIFGLVVSYKLMRMKFQNEVDSKCSDCCTWKFRSQNDGNTEGILQHIAPSNV